MKSLSEILLEKLKVTNKTSSFDDEHSIEVPYYEFVLWYTGYINGKPDEIDTDAFIYSDFVSAVVDTNGNERFKNVKLAYEFYKNHKDDIVTITIEQMRGPAGDNGAFLNTIDFGYDVFYVETDDNFKEYIENMHR